MQKMGNQHDEKRHKTNTKNIEWVHQKRYSQTAAHISTNSEYCCAWYTNVTDFNTNNRIAFTFPKKSKLCWLIFRFNLFCESNFEKVEEEKKMIRQKVNKIIIIIQ